MLITSIAFKNNNSTYDFTISELEVLKGFRDGIYKNPFNFEIRSKLNDLTEIVQTSHCVYSIEHRIKKNNLFVFFSKEFIMVEHSRYVNIPILEELKTSLNKFAYISEQILCGFETSLFVDDLVNTIDSTLEDRSLYPIYLCRNMDMQPVKTFKKHSLPNSDKKMELYVESTLKEILRNINYIIE